MYQVMEHEYFAKGLTETVLTTLWVVLNKRFCSVLGSIFVILMAVVGVVSVAVVMKHSHSKQTAGELYETSDAIGMKENEAYGTNTQT